MNGANPGRVLEPSRHPPLKSAPIGALSIGIVVFAFSLLGILTRPSGALAAFWPANAVLLGCLVRWPQLAGPWAWIAATTAFMAADLLTGGSLVKAAALSAANLTGVTVGYLLFRRLAPEHRTLHSTPSVVYFIVIVVASSSCVGIAGAAINPLLFGGSAASGLLYWFTSELVDYLAILPVVLTMPAWKRPRLVERRGLLRQGLYASRIFPVCALVLGMLLGIAINGPGAMAYMVPGLLWCALTYRLFTTAVLTLLCSIWNMLAVSTGFLHFGADFSEPLALQSFRIAVALTAMGPLTVATVVYSRNQVQRQLLHAATHDPLTGCLNRAGFARQAEALLLAHMKSDRPNAVLMVDIDHFKSVNDTHGHATGDKVLQAVSARMAHTLRATDLLGRWGGEEFAVLLPDCLPATAQQVAQRLCDECAQACVRLHDGSDLARTVSIGVACFSKSPPSLDVALSIADDALYRAKEEGRNRVVTAP